MAETMRWPCEPSIRHLRAGCRPAVFSLIVGRGRTRLAVALLALGRIPRRGRRPPWPSHPPRADNRVVPGWLNCLSYGTRWKTYGLLERFLQRRVRGWLVHKQPKGLATDRHRLNHRVRPRLQRVSCPHISRTLHPPSRQDGRAYCHGASSTARPSGSVLCRIIGAAFGRPSMLRLLTEGPENHGTISLQIQVRPSVG